jgi:hypothetical protein
MNATQPNPAQQYSERLRLRELRLTACERLSARIGTARLALAAAFLLLGWCCAIKHRPSAVWLLLPAVLFVAIVIYHQRVRLACGRALRAVAFYQAGVARLRGEPAGHGATGERFADPHHVYADDLDLFGRGSLYALLCTARTPMGETALAQWLLQPADLDTIRERHAAIDELRGALDLREDLATLGGPMHIALHPDALARWIDAPDELAAPWILPLATGLAVLAAAAATVWAVWGLAFPLLAVLAAAAGLNQALRNRVQRSVAAIEDAYEDLRLMAALLRRIEGEDFASPALRRVRDSLRSHSQTASATLSKLATLVNFIEARRNPFLAPLLLPLLYTIQSALAAERWRRRHGRVVGRWLGALGEIEALQSIAGYGFERPADPFPVFIDGPTAFCATGLGHPLITAATRVRNDVEIAGATRVLLVSGSNMSGKSTLLRSVGVNCVLAMAGAPVCATQLRLTPLKVGASIRVNDSLHEGSSRFYAEITRLRQLFEPSPLPLLFLLDELLQGTNSTDRRIGAQGVVRALIERGAIGLVSTHDLTLTDSAAFPAAALRNVHFQDELEDGRLTFDFRLRDGTVTKSNGIELMRAIGLDV